MDRDHIVDTELLRVLHREHQELDSLDLFTRVVERSSLPINDPDRIEAALGRVREGLDAALSRSSTSHGWRTQNQFEAVVASLGAVRLLKTEDAGSTYVVGPPVKVPDFRIVTANGLHLLVEIKNFYRKRHDAKFVARRADLEALRSYADAVGVPSLMLGIYWAALRWWTLVPVERLLEQPGRNPTLSFPEAAVANQMVLVGDHTIGTEWPLAVTLLDDRPVIDRIDPTRVDTMETHNFEVSRVEHTVAGRVVASALEKAIIERLMLYGGWEETTSIEHKASGGIASISFSFCPIDADERMASEDFALHRPMSSIYAAMFDDATLDADGHVTNLRVAIDPGELARLMPSGYLGDVLRLWRFHLHPGTP